MKLNSPQKKCPTCNIEMTCEFLERHNWKLNGWWCTVCERFDKAVGRERFFRKHDIEQAQSKKKAPDSPKAKAKSGDAPAKASKDESGED